jgi:predicted amidohydrolase YtcJ
MEPDFPGVDAIAIQGEKIVAIGSDEEVMALQGPETQVWTYGACPSDVLKAG